jgi:gluconate kinase
MGVGKTTVAEILIEKLPSSAYVDADWLWSTRPFQVTDELKQIVMSNIHHVMNGFIHCSTIENVVFTWVMHDERIVRQVVDGLDADSSSLHYVRLSCSEEELTRRIVRDCESGVRSAEVLERALARARSYVSLPGEICIDVGALSPEDVAVQILRHGDSSDV